MYFRMYAHGLDRMGIYIYGSLIISVKENQMVFIYLQKVQFK